MLFFYILHYFFILCIIFLLYIIFNPLFSSHYFQSIIFVPYFRYIIFIPLFWFYFRFFLQFMEAAALRIPPLSSKLN
jgi:hypothetical protein